ncbi:hypothetical protein QTO34_016768 [Cnephaeus nilssonii]|uniref:Uncharacterized protein n=1 Tax=Cnephaeus nilssonii TaxID=3371016 RepID=A0AA40LQL3_CNENI|nr:hypothetical protein QTO34_016768 [Eptesicus nilssonii]
MSLTLSQGENLVVPRLLDISVFFIVLICLYVLHGVLAFLILLLLWGFGGRHGTWWVSGMRCWQWVAVEALLAPITVGTRQDSGAESGFGFGFFRSRIALSTCIAADFTCRMLDWTGLYYGAEILGSGLNSDPAEDKIGLFHAYGPTIPGSWVSSSCDLTLPTGLQPIRANKMAVNLHMLREGGVKKAESIAAARLGGGAAVEHVAMVASEAVVGSVSGCNAATVVAVAAVGGARSWGSRRGTAVCEAAVALGAVMAAGGAWRGRWRVVGGWRVVGRVGG